ncbi:MAG TPA: SigE family RNA polymerase sigma factor [Actinomycetota bacterium]|jgi:RNA polymerase sigma-70 factor (sigma-E family)|nr:SigE family RNA polymerase sigma factor [Actinomycetota bacterium]
MRSEDRPGGPSVRIKRSAEPEPGGRSLAELFVRQVPRAVAIAYLMTGDRALAEDLAQEAFVRLAGRFRHIRSPEAFDAYLRRTVVNLSLSHLRRRRVERAYLERERHRAPRPAEAMPDVGTRELLWAALLELPARQRAALVLRYYEDLSERQTAEILAASTAAVRSLVARGIEALRQRIRGEDDA